MIKICSKCGEERKIHARDMCCACYMVVNRIEHPERSRASRKKYYEGHKDKCLSQTKEYREKHSDKVKEWSHDYYVKNSDRLKAYRRDYINNLSPDERKAYNRKRLNKSLEKQTCNILKEHARDLKDDPERLTTDFMQKIIGIKCKENK